MEEKGSSRIKQAEQIYKLSEDLIKDFLGFSYEDIDLWFDFQNKNDEIIKEKIKMMYKKFIFIHVTTILYYRKHLPEDYFIPLFLSALEVGLNNALELHKKFEKELQRKENAAAARHRKSRLIEKNILNDWLEHLDDCSKFGKRPMSKNKFAEIAAKKYNRAPKTIRNKMNNFPNPSGYPHS